MIALANFFTFSVVFYFHASRKLLGLDEVVVGKLSSVVLIDIKVITDATLLN